MTGHVGQQRQESRGKIAGDKNPGAEQQGQESLGKTARTGQDSRRKQSGWKRQDKKESTGRPEHDTRGQG
jgi:hypothetical protein